MWYVYVVECSDGTLYTGVATDLDKRLEEHNIGIGAKYTRGRRPVKIVHFEEYGSRSEACRREYQIKQLSKKKKLALVAER